MKKLHLSRVLLLPLVCAACSSPLQQAQVDGYMSQDSTGIYWVEGTENNGQLTGTYNTCALNALTHKYDGASFPITGTHNGTNINITVDASLIKLPISGMLYNNTLVLKVQQSGQTQSRSFTGASNDDYQKALNDFIAKYL